MNRAELDQDRMKLMSDFLKHARKIAQETVQPARSARRATYKTCRYCGEMMIQAHKGGLECAAGCIPTSEIDFSGQHELTNVER